MRLSKLQYGSVALTGSPQVLGELEVRGRLGDLARSRL
jgi:hypothetical protein